MNEPTAKYPKNFQAILDWCESHRPDLRPIVLAEKNNDGFILLMQVGFESGREFQHDHPDFPLNEPRLYAVPESPAQPPTEHESTPA